MALIVSHSTEIEVCLFIYKRYQSVACKLRKKLMGQPSNNIYTHTSLLSRVTTRILSGTMRELVLLKSVMSVHLTVSFVSLANIYA